jgi:hypothetical protein
MKKGYKIPSGLKLTKLDLPWLTGFPNTNRWSVYGGD